jgi:cell division septation protein DedD
MSPKYLVLAMLLSALAAPLPAQSVKAGIDAWQRADYPGAVAIWRPLAEAGDADAQFNIGQAYRLGRGVELNLAAAKIWFERAARNGHLDAETTLGLLTFQNGDRAEGLKWLKQAADQGEPRALLVYGTALYNGDGVTQDRILGYAYVSRAATQGLEPAKETLAQLEQLMTAADRQKGVALARAIPSGSPVPSKPKPVKVATAKPPAPKPTPPTKPSPVTRASPPPSPATKAPPPPATPATGGWRIQLGAFGQRGGAEALYQRVSGKAALAGRSPYYIASGAVTRLQVGPFASKGAAAAACSSIGVPCFPVPAK